MKLLSYTILFLLLRCGELSAQERDVFLELGGSGGLGSVNYEYWLPPKIFNHNGWDESGVSNWRYTLRGGFGLSPVDRNNGWVVVLPMMFNVLYGKHEKSHRLEFGAGIAPSFTTTLGGAYIKSPLMVGYRFMPFEKHFFFRADYTPIVGWLVDYQWEHWFGLSIGYKLS